jgi:hypothetical protein
MATPSAAAAMTSSAASSCQPDSEWQLFYITWGTSHASFRLPELRQFRPGLPLPFVAPVRTDAGACPDASTCLSLARHAIRREHCPALRNPVSSRELQPRGRLRRSDAAVCRGLRPDRRPAVGHRGQASLPGRAAERRRCAPALWSDGVGQVRLAGALLPMVRFADTLSGRLRPPQDHPQAVCARAIFWRARRLAARPSGRLFRSCLGCRHRPCRWRGDERGHAMAVVGRELCVLERRDPVRRPSERL